MRKIWRNPWIIGLLTFAIVWSSLLLPAVARAEDQPDTPAQVPAKPIIVQVVSSDAATAAGIEQPANPDQFNCISISRLLRLASRIYLPMSMFVTGGGASCSNADYTPYVGAASLKSLGAAVAPTIGDGRGIPETVTKLNAVPASSIPYPLETTNRQSDLLTLTQLPETESTTRMQLLGVWRLGEVFAAGTTQSWHDELLRARVLNRILELPGGGNYANMVMEPGDQAFSAPYGAAVILGPPCDLLSYPATITAITPLPVLNGGVDVWVKFSWNQVVLDSCGSPSDPIDLRPFTFVRFYAAWARVTQVSRDLVEQAIEDYGLRNAYEVPVGVQSDDGVLQQIGNGLIYVVTFGIATYVFLQTRGAAGLMDGSYLIVLDNSQQVASNTP